MSPGRQGQDVRGKSGLWAALLALPLLVQLVGWIFKIPHLQLSHHVEDRLRQGVISVLLTLLVWCLWHWGIGRRIEAGWPDAVAILLGLLYWYVSVRWPLPW